MEPASSTSTSTTHDASVSGSYWVRLELVYGLPIRPITDSLWGFLQTH
jgi:hypothetical protein